MSLSNEIRAIVDQMVLTGKTEHEIREMIYTTLLEFALNHSVPATPPVPVINAQPWTGRPANPFGFSGKPNAFGPTSYK